MLFFINFVNKKAVKRKYTIVISYLDNKNIANHKLNGDSMDGAGPLSSPI